MIDEEVDDHSQRSFYGLYLRWFLPGEQRVGRTGSRSTAHPSLLSHVYPL